MKHTTLILTLATLILSLTVGVFMEQRNPIRASPLAGSNSPQLQASTSVLADQPVSRENAISLAELPLVAIGVGLLSILFVTLAVLPMILDGREPESW